MGMLVFVMCRLQVEESGNNPLTLALRSLCFSKRFLNIIALISKFNVGLKTILREGVSEPEFYGDPVYKYLGNLQEGMIFF